VREVDMVTVSQYSEAMERGDKFPAIGVVDDGEAKWLYAGFHRIQAAQEAGLEHFEAEVREGTRLDAEYLACTENAIHGVPRTREEKWAAVERALRLRPDKSGRKIARDLKVGHTFVEKVRKSLTGINSSENQERTYTTKHGTVTTMKTGNIGGRARANDLAEPLPVENAQVNQIETLPEVVEPKSDIVVEFAGKQINTLGDLMKVRTEDQKLLNQFFELDLAVIKVRKLVTELSAHPPTKIRSILYGRDEITSTLNYQATSLGESAQFYRELSNGEESTGSN